MEIEGPVEGARIIRERVAELRAGIDAAARAVGRDPGTIALMAVSKFHDEGAVRAAHGAGLRLFGENRVQEAMGKFGTELRALPDLRVHMIGSLQTNKAAKAADFFDGIQSVHSTDLLDRLVSRSVGRAVPLELYFEVHTAEDSKSGFRDMDELSAACERWQENPGSTILRGLMTMAPFTADEGVQRASFSRLRELKDRLSTRFGIPGLTELSMGMSNDYLSAVKEGSTMLRIGTLIFGSRD